MKKFFFCISLVLTGLVTSCVDKYEEVDADSKPSWLGSSIYAELKNPDQSRLTGTFTNYLRLVDDLGYSEVLNRTGSKTVFPANDEAFQRFFSSNEWGVTSYEDLTEAQKKLLFSSSMLDNALLLGLLPNAYNTTDEPQKGSAIKHATTVTAIDSITHLKGQADMPKGNPYWEKYYNKGIDVVCDSTVPMMVHLTREYMLKNDITTVGDESDFAILTGTPYSEGMAYVFNNRVINGDVTCQNGYIHQLENVLVPPGNMAQVLRKHSKTRYYSRILDHWAVPFYDPNTTRLYNDWAMANGQPMKDSIFQMRYLSGYSHDGKSLTRDPNRATISTTNLPSYDAGWNQYYPALTGNSQVDASILDIGAFFVPDDNAVKQYFLPGGGGSHLMEIYGDKPNTEENLMENLDSLHAKKPEIMAAFTQNLMKPRFTQTVPSKFPNVTNDASENMGLTIDLIDKKDDGKYDITIANNGVVYLINEMIVPDKYRSVVAPASEYPDMRVMNWAYEDGVKTGDYLGVDFKYYLMAMSANYGLFIPEDSAFNYYYVDPATWGHIGPDNKQRPDVLHFYYDANSKSQPYVKCNRYYYNMETGEITGPAREVNISDVKAQMVDILNYHTLVLKSGETLGDNHYYKTKHGGAVYVDGGAQGNHVMSGLQIERPDSFPAATMKTVYNEKNGKSFRLDRLIQAPRQSVYSVLKGNAQFSDFMELCTGFQVSEVLTWAGISDETNPATGRTEQDAYTVFTHTFTMGKDVKGPEACLDMNVKMFNTYNYTLFAPDNTAMQQAYANGLPKWSQVDELYQAFDAKLKADPDYEPTQSDLNDMAKAKRMITAMRDFVFYHFVINSVFADNTIDGGRYQTLATDNTGVAKEVVLSGGGGQLLVADQKSGHTVSINANASGKVVNRMTRDYWFGTQRPDNDKVVITPQNKRSATSILTSSFCTVHQISEPLCGNASGRFDQ